MTIPVMPNPQKVTVRKGVYAGGLSSLRVSPDALKEECVAHKMRALGATAVEDRALPPHSLCAGDGDARALAPPKYAEAYALDITPRGIALRGSDAGGVYYGLVTLGQLLRQNALLPAARVLDWPAFPVRYHHDDISRRQVSTLDDFKNTVRLLAEYKMNHYTLYIEDMLHLKSFPDIGADRGRLTREEVRAIVREGELHHVTVFPTFTLIGHCENLLAMPKYRHLGREVWQSMSSLDPCKPAVRAFLKKVIADVCELFPSPYFHMGFDETQGLSCKDFLSHANWCAEELARRGKTPLMWIDMICRHFGYDTIRKLHPAIIPVNWNYGDTSKGAPHHDELARRGRPVWCLAGYGTWCTFLPDAAAARKHFAGWTKQMTRTPAPGFGSSSWCDVGAENHRALPWNIYASFAEFAWSGRRSEPESQAGRFQQSFYGAGLPRLTWVTDVLPQRLAISPRRSWQLFRKNAFAMIRIAAANPGLQIAAARDEKALQRARRFILNSRNSALLNKGQLDLLGSSIERALSVVHRILFSYRYLEGVLPRHRKRAFSDVVKELAACGRNYEKLWLRHNKRPNIEISLAVIDRVLESYKALERTHGATGRMRRYLPLDLAGQYNTMFAECSGMPFGASTVNGVPFSFADAHHTHAALKPGADELHIAFKRTAVKDIHLLVNGVLPKDRKAKPGLRVEVFDGERRVLDETLEQVAHLVDWWAPLGEHMWAGNGFAYADKTRVRYGFSPDTFFGIMHVSNFKLPAGTHATGVKLTAVAPEEVQLFAVTIER